MFQHQDSGRESLRLTIYRLYGEECFQRVRRLGVLRKRKAHTLASMAFLMRCRDTNTIPKFLRQHRIFHSGQAHRIYDRTERALLRERIHYTRKELAKTDRQLLSLHLWVSKELDAETWKKVDQLTAQGMVAEYDTASERQKRKYEQLQHTKSITPSHLAAHQHNTVVNLSKHNLSEEERLVLTKGGNFAVSPNTIPVEDIIANVEAGIKKQPSRF